MASLRKLSEELSIDQPAYSETSNLTRKKDGLLKLVKDAGFADADIVEDNVPVRFTTPDDWWQYGRGSTWGDLLLDRLSAEQRAEFRKQHEDEIRHHFGSEGIRAKTPVLFALGKKPE
jgi:hypothetical protein